MITELIKIAEGNTAESYLEKMQVSFEEIKVFYEVTAQLRKFELES